MKREQEENHSISGQFNIQKQLTVYNLIFVEKNYTRECQRKKINDLLVVAAKFNFHGKVC